MTSLVARHTPVHRGTAAWSAILPGQPAPVVLEQDQTADFVLVGGGFHDWLLRVPRIVDNVPGRGKLGMRMQCIVRKREYDQMVDMTGGARAPENG